MVKLKGLFSLVRSQHASTRMEEEIRPAELRMAGGSCVGDVYNLRISQVLSSRIFIGALFHSRPFSIRISSWSLRVKQS